MELTALSRPAPATIAVVGNQAPLAGLATPDAELASRIAAGEEAAIRRLIEDHQGVVNSFLRRRLRDPRDLEEVLQDVFVAAWRAAGRFRPDGRLRPWLLGIAYHLAVSRLRSLKTPDPLPDALADGGPGPADNAAAAQLRERVRQAVAALPLRQREVIALRFLDELSCEEAAEILGVPVGTVKSRTHAAIKSLAGTLETQR